KAMKKVAGRIKLELAQYRELAAFAQFGSELDKETKDTLDQGERMLQILRQPQYSPVSVEHQVIILYAALNKYLADIPVDRISQFENEFLLYVDNNHPEIIEDIKTTKDLTEENIERIQKAIA